MAKRWRAKASGRWPPCGACVRKSSIRSDLRGRFRKAFRSPCSNPRNDSLAEQAGRPDDEDPDDDDQRQRQLQVGSDDISAGEIFHDAEQEATGYGAARRVDAAEQRTGEAVKQ